MNILYLCDEYPPGRHGGIGTSVQLLARQMVKMGHRVIVAGLYSPGYGGTDGFDDEGVKVYRYRWGIDSKWFNDQLSLRVRLGNRILKDTGIMDGQIKRSLENFRKKLEGLIAKNQIDLIEMPDYNDYIKLCRSYIPFPVLPVPVVVKLNGSVTYFKMEAGEKVPAHILKMERAIMNQAAAVSSASSYTANKSAAYFSYTSKITVLYNGIDTDAPITNTPKHPLQVIFTGTLTKKKGILQLAKAWNTVIKTMPAARLLVLGKGNQQKVVSLLDESARKTVSFLGHVTLDEVRRHLAASVVSIFPSYAEAFALAPLEAMACGTAVINSNRTSGPELIDDGINGLLADPDDIEQIAWAIIHLLKNPNVCTGLAKKGQEKVKRDFDIAGIAAQNLQFYAEVINNGRKN